MPQSRVFQKYTLGQVLGHRVYARQSWSEPWALQQYVHCTVARWSCAPSISSAELVYRYGYGLVPGAGQTDIINPYTLPALAYVRIEFDVVDYDKLVEPEPNNPDRTTKTRRWHGVVGTIVDQLDGHDVTNPVTGNAVPSGTQLLPAVGLEWLLERDYLDTVWFDNDQIELGEQTTPPWFNRSNRPDRSPVSRTPVNGQPSFVFYSDLREFCSWWRSRDVLEYAVNTFDPQDGQQVWRLDDPLELMAAIDDRPQINCHNTRRRALINQLCSRQRGLSWRVHVDDQNRINVAPITFATSNLVSGGTVVLRANHDRQFTLENHDDRSGGIQLVTDATSKYDRVRVRGARAVYCFTVSDGYGTVENAWTVDQRVEYDLAGSNEAGYPPAAQVFERELWHLSFRARPSVADVYRRFRLTVNFANNGTNDTEPLIVSPETGNGSAPMLYHDLRVLSWIPLQVGDDYEGTAVPAVRDDPRYRQPFAAFPVPTFPGRYVDVSNLHLFAHLEGFGGSTGLPPSKGERDNFRWAAHIVPDPGEPGFELQVTGQPRHVIGGRLFIHRDEDAFVGQWSFYDADFTIAVEGPHYCEAVEPPTSGGAPPSGTDRERMIDAGDQFQLHYLAPGTRVEARKRTDQFHTSGDWIRDDRPKLERIAKLAYVWYGDERRGLEFSTSLITDAFEVGDLITEVLTPSQDYQVNSVVTEIEITSPVVEGSTNPPAPRVQYRTNFTELDFVTLIPGLHKNG